MKTNPLLKTNFFKFVLPFVILLSIIYLFKYGYQFGQWLDQITN